MTGILAMLLACGTPEPTEPEAKVEQAAPEAAEAPAEAPKPAAPVVEDSGRVNLNTASKEALEAIPGITPKLVHEFEEYRPYVSIQQFRKEIGKYISEEEVAAFEPHVFVPVDPNNCDAPTLMQIEGVTEAIAKDLIGRRPYTEATDFARALGEHLGEDRGRMATAQFATGF